jgi:hypothetical protein
VKFITIPSFAQLFARAAMPVQEAREKKEVCYCQDTLKMTDRENNLEWPKLPAHTAIDRPRSVMTMVVAILALLATGGAFCIFCL